MKRLCETEETIYSISLNPNVSSLFQDKIKMKGTKLYSLNIRQMLVFNIFQLNIQCQYKTNGNQSLPSFLTYFPCLKSRSGENNFLVSCININIKFIWEIYKSLKKKVEVAKGSWKVVTPSLCVFYSKNQSRYFYYLGLLIKSFALYASF